MIPQKIKKLVGGQNLTIMVPKNTDIFLFSIRIKILWCTQILKKTVMLLETWPRQNHPKIRYFFDFGETHDTMIPENIEKKMY